MASLFCTQCGHANPDPARYCRSCGSALAGAGPGPDPATECPAGETTTAAFPAAAAEAVQTGPDAPPVAGQHADAALGLTAGTALLVVKHGPGAGGRFLLDAAVTTAGRHPEADMFLDDVTVSRRHAEFHRHPEGFTVTDVGSRNGTYVNRGRVQHTTLTGGDEIQIGKFRMVFLTP